VGTIGGRIQLIWAGQSNALGASGVVYGSPYANPNRADIGAYKRTKIGVNDVEETWGNLRPNQYATVNWHGPDLPCAMDLVDDYAKSGVHLIMRALGSTEFATQWYPTDTVEARGEAYRDLVTMVAATRAAYPAETDDARPWVVINIGEEDAADVTDAGNYEANCLTFLRQCLRKFGNGTRFVIVSLHDDCTRTHAGTVRTAQIAVCTAWEGRAFRLDPTPLCTVAGDGIHYDDEGLAVGQAIATLIAGEAA
jgi:hypothetical protein